VNDDAGVFEIDEMLFLHATKFGQNLVRSADAVEVENHKIRRRLAPFSWPAAAGSHHPGGDVEVCRIDTVAGLISAGANGSGHDDLRSKQTQALSRLDACRS